MLKENLYQLRDAVGKYPDSLDALATDKYLRKVPVDQITESAANFPVFYWEFAAARSYADWRFMFVPLVQSAASPDARTSPR